MSLGFFDLLGIDESGLPTHLPMGVNAEGQGPTDDADAHHLECWCGQPDCLLTRNLMWAYRLGRKEGSSGRFVAGQEESA